MTTEQSIVLAAIEQAHGKVLRLPDEHPLAEQLLRNCVTDTRAYRCEHCSGLFTIEPDGETDVWMLT